VKPPTDAISPAVSPRVADAVSEVAALSREEVQAAMTVAVARAGMRKRIVR
jgi:hypothetical protein